MIFFTIFLKKEDYHLEDVESTRAVIHQFIQELKELGSENLGNGRLMRKFFQSAVGFMAERSDHDMETLSLLDIEQAIHEIWRTEKIVGYENDKIIGFVHK